MQDRRGCLVGGPERVYVLGGCSLGLFRCGGGGVPEFGCDVHFSFRRGQERIGFALCFETLSNTTLARKIVCKRTRVQHRTQASISFATGI